jgi:hypothetical protein
MKDLGVPTLHCLSIPLICSVSCAVEFVMQNAERIFTLKLREDLVDPGNPSLGARATTGELWQGGGRVPVAGLFSYRGRVDAVITFFVDQFLTDALFQAGDGLALASGRGESFLLLTRRSDSDFTDSLNINVKPEEVL